MPIQPGEVVLADRTIRMLGALVILIGIAVAGVIQINVGAEEAPAEIVVSDEPLPESTTAPDSTTTPSSAQEPFIYRVGVLASVSTNNFWAFYGEQPSVWNSYILGPTKPALMTVDAGTHSLRNELVTDAGDPTWNADGWRVRVNLRDDFGWSDGTPLTAHDIVYTFNTARSLQLGGSWAEVFPESIESLHADGDHQLRIEFSERPRLSVWPHAVGLAPIMAEHIWGPITTNITSAGLYAADGTKDVGGGQLALVSSNDDQSVSVRNPGYPIAGGPDVVEYHVYPDESSLVGGVVNGEIDSVLTPNGLAPEHLATVESDPGVAVLTNRGTGIRYLGFNLARDPMSAAEFRTALALLMDRAAIAEAIPTISEASYVFVSSENQDWYNPEKAAAIAEIYGGSLTDRLGRALDGLKKIGYSWTTEPSVSGDGTILAGSGLAIGGREPQPLTILTPGDTYDPARPEYVARIAETLGLLGFDARPVETDFDTVVDLAFTADEDGALHYDMYLLGWTLGSPALPGYYRPLFAPDGELNNTGYSSSSFNNLLNTYESAYESEEASVALWNMESMLATELPYLVLYHSQITEIYRADRIVFDPADSLGGIQARLGGIGDVSPLN